MATTTITLHLFFGGRCEEAIQFYKKALGAECQMMMRFNESPDATPPGMLQEGFEKKIMHASIVIRGNLLMLSDGCDDKTKASGYKLAISLPNETDALRVYDALSDGGKADMPLTKTFWSPCFGMLTDRFGIEWMVSVPGPMG
ncbi:MAG: VOC family protein [Gemmataceae bacterium]